MDHVMHIFEDPIELEETLRKFETVGIQKDQVSILASDATRNRQFRITSSSKSGIAASAGAAIGGLAGAVIAALMSAGAVAVPGMNIIVSGYLVSAMAGLGAGAAAGGLVGALIGLGVPEYEAKVYENRLRDGNILVAVKPIDEVQQKHVESLFRHADKYSQKRADAGTQDAYTG